MIFLWQLGDNPAWSLPHLDHFQVALHLHYQLTSPSSAAPSSKSSSSSSSLTDQHAHGRKIPRYSWKIFEVPKYFQRFLEIHLLKFAHVFKWSSCAFYDQSSYLRSPNNPPSTSAPQWRLPSWWRCSRPTTSSTASSQSSSSSTSSGPTSSSRWLTSRSMPRRYIFPHILLLLSINNMLTCLD